MSEVYNDIIKKAKSARYSAFMHFTGKFSRGSQVQERTLLELRSICHSEYNQKLSGSRKGAVGA